MSKETNKLAKLVDSEGMSPEILHQIKLVAKAIGDVETTVENHHERHELDGEDEVSIDWTQLVNVPPPEAHTHDAGDVISGVFDLARIPTPLKGKILSEVFTAGADITVGQVVAITGDNEVSPADNTLRSQSIGVALNDAAIGEQVEVVIYGKTTVVADGVISAGDPLAAAATAGRVVSLLSHSHTNPNTSSVDLAHTHGVGSLSIGAVGNHRHDCPTTGSAGGHFHGAGTLTADSVVAHTHSNPSTSSVDLAHRHSYTPGGSISSVSAGTPSGSMGNDNSSRWYGYLPTAAPTKYAATVSGGSPTSPFFGITTFEGANYLYGRHQHTFTGSALPTHDHTFIGATRITGAALDSHLHTQGSTGSAGAHGHTISGATSYIGSHTHSVGYTTYAGGHSHSITGSTGSALGSHSHTQGDTGVVNNAQIVGKALTAAVGAGVEIDMLVCLAG